MEIYRKVLAQIKAIDDAGTGTAIIATLGVIDSDGDVTEAGAFGSQSAKLIPAHDWGHVPLGKATIREEGDKVVAKFKLNLDIPAAVDWHNALKFDLENGVPLQEWSYGFSITEQSFGEHEGQKVRFLKSIKVHEISPVVAGAGVGTQTLAVKSWDGSAELIEIKTDQIAGRSIKLADQLRLALFDVEAVVKRCEDVRVIRKEDGRDLSPERVADLEAIGEELAGFIAIAKEIGEAIKKDSDREGEELAANAALAGEFARIEFEKSESLQK